MDVREMKAGRELDALVAEKVMGWTAVMDVVGGIKKGIVEGNIFSALPSEWIEVPNYSTDISAAWEVVEKRKTKDLYMRLFHDGEYGVSFRAIPKSPAFAETAPHAICIAALLAMEDKA